MLNTLLIGIIGGALISSMWPDRRSPILSDRLITAGVGAVIGLLAALVWCAIAMVAS